MVQKSYSVNFPGEFGGGVINLTTKAIPAESFLTIGGGIGWDTESTNKLSYTYYGSKTDWTGFDNGNRSLPSALKDYFNSDTVLSATGTQAQALGAILFTSRNSVVQKDDHTQPNFSGNLTGGTSFELGDVTLGVIAAAGYSNKTTTRSSRQQQAQGNSASADSIYSDFNTVQTDNRVVANGLLGLGLEWGQNQIRWTNVYIHDTDKHASLGLGHKRGNTTVDYIDTRTAFYERQMIDSQIVAELKPADDTKIDLRAGYANSKRLAPYEITSEYLRTNSSTDPYGDQYVNYMGTGDGNPATVAFSRLNENVWSAGADLTHNFSPSWSGTVGYNYQINSRTNTYRQFGVYASGSTNDIKSFGLLRLDVLLQPGVWYLKDFAGQSGVDYSLELRDLTANVGNFNSRLLNHAYYAKADGQITDSLSIDAGVRWEYAKEQTFLYPVGTDTVNANQLKNEYFLPAATLTYEIEPGMQVRLNASKTIARPQFRELLYQTYYDPDSNRTYRGNPMLRDSQLYNAEARFEWYFTRNEHVSLGGFYKHIKNPIESFLTGTETFITSYANAPSADLYGAELEVQKYTSLDKMGGLFTTRRLVFIGNYTFTKSKLNVSDTDTTQVYGTSTTQYASTYFQDGAPLTGQSKHIANLQIGMEDTARLSQQTILLNYASKRTVSRGFIGTIRQPDVIENPGFTVDLVIRQGFDVAGKQLELKLEGRNLTGRKHEEYQQLENGRVEFNTYDLGRVFNASLSLTF